MTNTELTLDQLQAISGGQAQRNTHDGFRAEYALMAMNTGSFSRPKTELVTAASNANT